MRVTRARYAALLLTAAAVACVPAAASAVSGSPTPQFSVSPGNLSLATDAGTTATATVTATSNGNPDQLTAGFQSGAPTWSVAPTTCDLPAFGTCQFTLTFAPPAGGDYPGALTISDGTTADAVGLSGTGIVPQVAVSTRTDTVRRHHTFVVHGLVTATSDSTAYALPGRKVVLQRKPVGGTWASIASATSDGAGRVAYRLVARHTARYRLEVIGSSSGTVEAISSSVRVRVVP